MTEPMYDYTWVGYKSTEKGNNMKFKKCKNYSKSYTGHFCLCKRDDSYRREICYDECRFYEPISFWRRIIRFFRRYFNGE